MRRILVLGCIGVLALGLLQSATAGDFELVARDNDEYPASALIPREAKIHQRTLIRSARAHWGLDAPVATFAAQIHQESRWHVGARSPVGAEGLAQFMPATSEWFARINPQDLTTAQPFNPAWSMRALVLYNAWNHKRIVARDNCNRWSFTLSAYNGGLGWVQRDQALASASGADGLVYNAVAPFNAGRSAASISENRHYVTTIINQWQPLYVQAGWGHGVCYEF
ncbi:transglycosylase SLT domain-containing protein [Rheinheimera gaetbuli]